MSPQAQLSNRGLPVANGIELVSTHSLPDRLRSIFPFPLFNAVQSKCFPTVFRTDNNFVLSSPTGSGKTAVLELAICRLVSSHASGSFKVVYQAPTKSLCSERRRDWRSRFSHLNLTCAELTGDSNQSQLRDVQSADIIITTPEKWDSMTRKWRDHQKLLELVKLFLIDEVHILKEDRGASLEVVVSRMKSIGSKVRFIALSASIPNSEDIASWLGKDCRDPTTPAAREVFGEGFRPVKLQKHVCGYRSDSNDFAFDKVCDAKLPEVISSYSANKPIMIFCFTRGSTEITAKYLAEWWGASPPGERYWPSQKQRIPVEDRKLQTCILASVAFHHAGMGVSDRNAVEKAYLSGDINVICCTSTLAVGVNLPCHLVIIKNTVCYQNSGCKEYSDLEIMQMLGRAGRPQYDDTATAVIMTKLEKVSRYEKMVSGQEILESRLHQNLIDHLNAEIGLGTVHSFDTAKRWLAGTFLAVRFRANPRHYKLSDTSPHRESGNTLDIICQRDVELLQQYDLVTEHEPFKSTDFGDAMARYYVQFETMKIFLGLQPRAKTSEILSAIAQAAEFKSVRLRLSEKPLFKEINNSPFIRFPIKVDLSISAHKVSLILQSLLGGLDLRNDDRFKSQFVQYNADQNCIMQHVHRLARCIIDCQLHLGDSIAARNAMELARSLGARVWDDSALQLTQIEKIGPAAYRKLVNAGIKSIQELENTDPYKINVIMSRNPPYGHQLLETVKLFPKLRVSIKMTGSPVVRNTNLGRCIRIQIKTEVGFINETVPLFFNKKPVHICVLAESSEGRKLHFCKIKAQKLVGAHDVFFNADITSPQQVVTCYVSCDDIAGTLRQATLKPDIPAGLFPEKNASLNVGIANTHAQRTRNFPYDPKKSANDHTNSLPQASNFEQRQALKSSSEDFDDSGLEDFDLQNAAGDLDYNDIDNLKEVCTNKENILAGAGKQRQPVNSSSALSGASDEVQRLPNGKYACCHNCKDKKTCLHLCCREGMKKPPKALRAGFVGGTKSAIEAGHTGSGQSQIRGFVKQIKLKPLDVGITTDGDSTKRSGRMNRLSDDCDTFNCADSNVYQSHLEKLSNTIDRDTPQYHRTQGSLYFGQSENRTDKSPIVEINLTGQSLKRDRSPKESSSLEKVGEDFKRQRQDHGIFSRQSLSSRELQPSPSPIPAETSDEYQLAGLGQRSSYAAEECGQSINRNLNLFLNLAGENYPEVQVSENLRADAISKGISTSTLSDHSAQQAVGLELSTSSPNGASLPPRNGEIEQWLKEEFGSCIEFV